MKLKSIYKLAALLLTATMLFFACTEESSDVRLDPKLSTSQVIDITDSSATVVGFVVAAGDGYTERGVCYNTQPNPTTSDTKVVFNEDSVKGATFSVTITGLHYTTKYYARAYAINVSGTLYGEELSFTTPVALPKLTTTAITEITGSSATSGGNVIDAGGADVTARGICFATHESPTIKDSITKNGDGLGEFTSGLTNLIGNTTYYVRAYATNSAGTGYGHQISFTTPVDIPRVITESVSEITKTTAVTGGNVTYDCGAEVTEKGIVLSTSPNPTTADTKFTADPPTGTGQFIINLEGLTQFTTYHVRAYAINSKGTAYGEDIQFITLPDITKFWVVGDYNGWDNSDNAKYIISTTSSGGLAEGYVYLTSGGIKLTTDHSWDNAHTFGDDGSGGLTNPGSNIPVPSDGYYRIRANLNDMTYSLLLTSWGIIGDATPLGWGDESPLEYKAALEQWIGAYHLTAAAFKFRANHSWDYNYGLNAGDNFLDAGGDNIPITMEDDYAITLDLSHPNEYTFSANRWGIIGGSVPPYDWSVDVNLTWDGVNKVFTKTLDLKAGDFKFRANDGWDVNFGGDLSALTQGGANIPIAEDGNYTITLDPWNKVGTVTKN